MLIFLQRNKRTLLAFSFLTMIIAFCVQLLLIKEGNDWENRLRTQIASIEKVIGSASGTNSALAKRGLYFGSTTLQEEYKLQDLNSQLNSGPQRSYEYRTISAWRYFSIVVFIFFSLLTFISFLDFNQKE